MKARLAVVAVAAALGAATLLPLGAGAQTAAAIVDVGWWTQNPAASAPAGGFEVDEGPNGSLSVAAFHIRVDATTLTQGVLSLSESQEVGTPALQVCTTMSSWTATSAGAYAQAPTPSCTKNVVLQHNASQAVWTGDVRALLGTGPTTVSLMVVPIANAALPVQTPFQTSFAKADLIADGDVAPAPAADTGTPPAADSGAFPAFDLGSNPAPPTFGVTGIGSTGFGTSASSDVPVAVPPLSQQVNSVPAQLPGRFPTKGDVGVPNGGKHKPWGRAPLLALAAIAVGAAVSFGRRRLQAVGWLEAS